MSRIHIPGAGSSLDMQQIQQQAAMRQAIVERTIVETGSRIYANLISAYYIGLPQDAKIDTDQVKIFANAAKQLSPFFAEALGLVTMQIEEVKKDAGK